MSNPFFIWTMRRTGGTSLTDLLTTMSEHNSSIQHEPFNLNRTFGYITKEFEKQNNSNFGLDLSTLFDKEFIKTPLIKHCYEITNSSLNYELISNIKNREYKHILLLRKDEESRIFSLLLALQTDVWGLHGSRKIYELIRSRKKTLKPIDKGSIDYEVDNSIKKTSEIKLFLEKQSIDYKTIYFEDFFEGQADKRFTNLYKLFEYLDFSSNVISEHQNIIKETILRRSQNSFSILKYLPNYLESKNYLLNKMIKG